LTTVNWSVIANSGAGSLPDLARMAGGSLALSAEDGATRGAGATQDHLKVTVTPQPGPDPLPGADPTMTSISPTYAPHGSADLTLTVNGTKFTPTSLVYFNGHPLWTTFNDAATLTATVQPSKFNTPCSIQVMVMQGARMAKTIPVTTFNFT
jgi:hypothetical protein